MKSNNRNSVEQTNKDEKEKSSSEDSQTFSSLFGKFASSTTAHGIGKVYAAHSSMWRLLWILSVLLVYSVMFWMCVRLLLQYLSKPVHSRMEVSQEEHLDFPAVTICNLNMLKDIQLKKYKHLYTKLQAFASHSDEANQTEYENGISIEIGNREKEVRKEVEKQKRAFKKREMARAKSKSEQNFYASAEIDTSGIMTKMVDNLLRNISVEKLKSMGHQFHEFVVNCRFFKWKCNNGSFRELWNSYWHWKYGNCYTFNSGISKDGKELPILTVERAGPRYGLELLIKIEEDLYLPTTEEAGIRVVLTDQRKMPFPFDEGFSVATGFSTSVGLTKVHTQRVDPFKNNSCVDTGEKIQDSDDFYKKMYKSDYSVLSCRKSCLASKQRKACNCSEIRLFSFDTLSCKTEEQEECLVQVMKEYQKSGLDCATKCPQPCLDNHFRYTLSSSKWSAKYLNKMLKQFRWKFETNDTLGPNSDNFLKLTIFYKQLALENIIHEQAYRIENLFADFGGQLGLWIGVSVLTVGEFIELVIKLAKIIGKKWMKKRRESVTIENSLEMKI